MDQLFESMDYRSWLKERMEEIKKEKPFFSYRYIASKIGVNPGHLARVFNGQSHITSKHAASLARTFYLRGRHQEYFEELVHFARAKKSEQVQSSFERLQKIRGEKFRTIADGEAEFYKEWYHMAVRGLISIHHFKQGHYKKIASRLFPKISVTQVKESLELLLELKLIRINEQEHYQITDTYISTGEKWHANAIREYQKQMVEQSVNALENTSKSLRDVSTLTLPFDRNQLDTVRERIRNLRQELIQMAKECESDSIYQLNIQLFPSALLSEKDLKESEL